MLQENRSTARSVAGNENHLPRFVRWAMLDMSYREASPCCWLDRATRRLIYQPDETDPNAL